MAITLVASVTATPGANGGTTAAIITTGADLLVVSIAFYGGGVTPTLSDSKGNSYTGLTARGNFAQQQLHYRLAPTVGTGHTVTASGTSSYPAITVYAFAGVASYQTQSGAGGSPTSSPLACGSVTPSANGALLVTGRCGLSASTDTVTPAGFTLTAVPYGGGTNMQGGAATAVQPTAGAINPTWAWTGGGTDNGVSAAVFLPSAGAAAVETVQGYVWGPL